MYNSAFDTYHLWNMTRTTPTNIRTSTIQTDVMTTATTVVTPAVKKNIWQYLPHVL